MYPIQVKKRLPPTPQRPNEDGGGEADEKQEKGEEESTSAPPQPSPEAMLGSLSYHI